MNSQTKRQQRHQQHSARGCRGAAIAEGAAILVIMVPLVAFLIVFLLDVYYLSTFNIKIQSVAQSGARMAVADKWWLGMTRTDFSVAAEQNARDAIYGQLAVLGLTCKAPPVFTYNRGVMLRKKDTTIVRVDFDVQPKLGHGVLFPSWVTLHARGVSSDAEHAVTKHGQIFFEAIDPNSHQGVGIRIPAYNATVGRETPAHPLWLHAGRSAGKYPVAYLRIQGNTDGSTFIRQQDVADENFNCTTLVTPAGAWPSSR